MHTSTLIGLFSLYNVASCVGRKGWVHVNAPKWTITPLGDTKTNLANVYRDGGGGGRVAGVNLINYSDTMTTNEPLEDGGNMTGFVSNSLAIMGHNGAGPQNFLDFPASNGLTPRLEVPWGPSERDGVDRAIWPNSGIAPACNGACGIAYYGVYNRAANNALLYTTGVNITLNATGYPSVTRPVEQIFQEGEPYYGKLSVLTSTKRRCIYLFATVLGPDISQPGLKLARAPDTSPFDRSTYEYWTGSGWSYSMPPRNDGGASNIFNATMTSGEVFWSHFYHTYMIIFGGVFGDPNIYMSYSTRRKLTEGWTEPVIVYTPPKLCGGGTQNFHAFPHFDETQRVIPLGFVQMDCYTKEDGSLGTLNVGSWANITFS